MKKNSFNCLIVILLCLLTLPLQAQKLNQQVFDLLNLNYKGLEKVKELHEAKRDKEAAVALLEYFRARPALNSLDYNLKKITVTPEEQKMANDALQHIFFAHPGYKPLNYGEDINWRYWPIKDNEVRWQLHRNKWYVPMGKMYQISKDEKYAKEWVSEYLDWIIKNPLVEKKTSPNASADDLENTRFAWRPLEVSHRIQDQVSQFSLFKNSPNFTPEFLTQFLVNYYHQADYILHNYSEQGNHLLFESQRMLVAGTYFPELKDANVWRNSGIKILDREIEKQVYDDGVQFELDPHYHLACIDIFFKALTVANSNGFGSEFPASYIKKVRKMIEVAYNLTFPDYSTTMFSDAKINDEKEMTDDFKKWLTLFKADPQIEWFASKGKKGIMPPYNSCAFKTGGFYVLRNGWSLSSTVMMLKAGPKGEWHCQPDNGTFELWIKGRNFFNDSGSYVYEGDSEVNKERAWFRQTMVHKTLTLDDKNLENTNSKCLLWDIKNPTEILVVENQSYNELKHRRSVFFVDKKFFVIVDEATGNAKGDVAIHYQLGEGKTTMDIQKQSVSTLFEDGNNVQLQGFCNQKADMANEEGWVSYKYKQKAPRKAFSFNVDKKTNEPVRFITVINTITDGKNPESIKAKFNNEYNAKGLSITVKIANKNYQLNYSLPN